jgi:hypothetical protein
VGVHLAAEGFDVKGLHTQEPVYGYRAGASEMLPGLKVF